MNQPLRDQHGTALASRRTRRGFSMASVMVFVMGFTTVGLTMMSLTVTADRHAERGSSKVQASLLAESGINALYDRIREQMWASNSYPLRINSTQYQTQTRHGNRSIGTFSARVISADSQLADVREGGRTLRRTTWTFLLEGTGVAENGTTSTMRARFTATVDQGLRSITTVVHTGPGAGQIYYPAAAIVSNRNVRIRTNQGLRVTSPDRRSGHVIGNQGLEWTPRTGDKSGHVNPNVIELEGLLMTTQGAHARSVGPTGLGNPNGSINYRTPQINNVTGLPNAAANSVVALTSPVQFADTRTVEGWITNWRATTGRSGATRYNTSITTDNVPQRPGDQWRIIETPAFINGDLTINPGEVLRLMPSSSNPTENIVYVRGNVRNLGQLFNLGVTVVVEGQYSDSPSAEYRLDLQGSPHAARNRLLQNSALVSVNSAPDAIQFTSNSSALTGLVYATRGGIRVTGNLEVRGMLVAEQDIELDPNNGNSFVVHYEPDAAGAGDFDPTRLSRIDVTLVPDAIVRAFTPGALVNWTQPK